MGVDNKSSLDVAAHLRPEDSPFVIKGLFNRFFLIQRVKGLAQNVTMQRLFSLGGVLGGCGIVVRISFLNGKHVSGERVDLILICTALMGAFALVIFGIYNLTFFKTVDKEIQKLEEGLGEGDLLLSKAFRIINTIAQKTDSV
jgi:hypothetical protein